MAKGKLIFLPPSCLPCTSLRAEFERKAAVYKEAIAALNGSENPLQNEYERLRIAASEALADMGAARLELAIQKRIHARTG